MFVFNIIVVVIIKIFRQCKDKRESDIHRISPKTPYQSEYTGLSDIHRISPKTPAPQYQPIDRKQWKEKIAEDYSRDRAG